MRSYEAARGMYSFLAFCSWVVIIVGAIVAFGGATAASAFARNAGAVQSILGAAPGIILSVVGFYGLALVQLGRAGVDSAEYAQQALQVSREQLEVSKQVLEQGRKTAASYGELLRNRPAKSGSSAETSTEDAGPSYANRTDEPGKHSVPASIDSPSEIPALEQTIHEPTNTTKQLENAPQLPIVERKNGVWRVGDEAFQHEANAKKYAMALVGKSDAKVDD